MQQFSVTADKRLTPNASIHPDTSTRLCLKLSHCTVVELHWEQRSSPNSWRHVCQAESVRGYTNRLHNVNISWWSLYHSLVELIIPWWSLKLARLHVVGYTTLRLWIMYEALYKLFSKITLGAVGNISVSMKGEGLCLNRQCGSSNL